MRKQVRVCDKMQQNYVYERIEPPGRNFHPEFKPDLTPAQNDTIQNEIFSK